MDQIHREAAGMGRQVESAGVGVGRSVLICGASFAGLATAYWMNRLGYEVTVVEIAKNLKRGGSPVDIRDGIIEIVKRMGIFDALAAHSLPPRATEFRSADDTLRGRFPQQPATGDGADGFEIERDILLDVMFAQIDGKIEILFDNTVDDLQETADGLCTRFADGTQRMFSLVFGCDGNHSLLRAMLFGPESDFSHFLGLYFSISIVDKLIIAANVTQIHSVPGRTVMLNSYEDKTDIVFCFHADAELPYDHRDQDQQRGIVKRHFAGLRWKIPALLEEVGRSDSFYFDKMCQIKMSSWSKGRVALVGDAAYCASPAAGMGGSLAIVGAATLAEAFERYGDDHAAAFEAYDRSLRPFIEQVQAEAATFGLAMFMPGTEEAICMRDQQLSAP